MAMEMDIRYANHPEDSKYYTTEQLRRHYLMEKVFEEDEIFTGKICDQG